MQAYKAIAVTLLAVFTVGSVFAQSPSDCFPLSNRLGAFFSLNRSGIIYDMPASDNVFLNFSLGLDYGTSVLRQYRHPGVSASFSYDFVIDAWRHAAGSSFLYIGPGLTAGYVHDRHQEFGFMAGITATLGYEFRFRRPLTLGVDIMPVFGVHMSPSGNSTLMDIYRNGLLFSAAPQLSLKYDFSSGHRSSRRGNDSLSGTRERDPDARGGRREWPLLTFGAEWGFSANLLHIYHHNYLSSIGRMDFRRTFLCFRSNGYVTLHGGINCTRNLNLSVYAGYEGIYKGEAVVPVSIRGTWYFGRDTSSPRWLAFLDGGWALNTSEFNTGAIARAGAGYRIPLTRSVKLDLMVSYEFTYASIDLYDESGNQVPVSLIRRNENYFSSLNFSIGITL